MSSYVALLRGVNVGGNKMVKMATLKAMCESLGLDAVRTHLQSGNVVFRSADAEGRLVGQIESAIAKTFGFESKIVIRSLAELKAVIDRDPFAKAKPPLNPSRVVVLFLANEPDADAKARLLAANRGPEALHLTGRELYIHYPDGIARSPLAKVPVEKILGTNGTARNWNTVNALHALAAAL
jgi:uncharacterized protein (DUF1697 family)